MTDEWSLKDKKSKMYRDYYPERVVDFLREKLIEDLKNIVKECKTEHGFRCNFAPKILLSLNKRFGVDVK
jgi:hypothetical protein